MTGARADCWGTVPRYNQCIVTSGQPGVGVSRYNYCIVTEEQKAWPLAMSRYNTTRAARRQTIGLRYAQGCEAQGHDTAAMPTTRPGHGHNMAQQTTCARGLSSLLAPWAHHARSQGQLCVHIVHLTYFWTRCTIIVTIWDTVHKIFQKKNQIKSNQIF